MGACYRRLVILVEILPEVTMTDYGLLAKRVSRLPGCAHWLPVLSNAAALHNELWMTQLDGFSTC